MAQLSTIISSILRDMVLAQHQANTYAIMLSDSYLKKGQTEKFPLPAVALGEMDLEIRYGIQNPSTEREQTEINYAEFRRLSKNIALLLAKIVVNKVASSILTSVQNDPDVDRALPAQLAKESELFRKYCSFLSRKFHQSIKNDFTNLMKEDGTLDENKLMINILRVSENQFLTHEEIAPFFDNDPTAEIKEKAIREMRSVLSEAIPDLIKDVNFLRKRIFPSIDVIIAADELAKLPEECIHSFKLKITPRELSLYAEENNDDE